MSKPFPIPRNSLRVPTTGGPINARHLHPCNAVEESRQGRTRVFFPPARHSLCARGRRPPGRFLPRRGAVVRATGASIPHNPFTRLGGGAATAAPPSINPEESHGPASHPPHGGHLGPRQRLARQLERRLGRRPLRPGGRARLRPGGAGP